MYCKGPRASPLCEAAPDPELGKHPKQIIVLSLVEGTGRNSHIQSSTNLFFSVDQNIGNKRFLKF